MGRKASYCIPREVSTSLQKCQIMYHQTDTNIFSTTCYTKCRLSHQGEDKSYHTNTKISAAEWYEY